MQTTQILKQLNSTDSFKELFEYISQNTYIPEFIEKAEINYTLLEAIQKGEDTHDIFNNKDCYLHLLVLIKNNKISFEVGMTVYSYLLALMQFTEKQPLKEEDQDVKFLRPIKISKLSTNGKLTPEGNKFLKSIFLNLTQENHRLNFLALEDFVLSLPPTEQWIIHIPHNHSFNRNKLNDLDNIFIALSANIPFLYDEKKFASERECWIPSISLIMYVLQCISPFTLKMKFCYGDLNRNTLKVLHSKSIHPVSIYGLNVKSNPKNADAYRCGPFAMWLHDIGHVYWGTKIDKKERDFIFDEFIPKLESLIQIAKAYNDQEVVQKLDMAIDKAGDFDLTPLTDYSNDIIGLYLARSLGGLTASTSKEIGESAEDRLYFLLRKMFYELSDIHSSWKSVFGVIQFHTTFRRQKIAKAIDHAAYTAVNSCAKNSNYPFFYVNIDWSYLSEKINNIEDGEILWDKLKKEYYQLSDLICLNHFIVFPPYLPITKEKIDALKQLTKDKLDEEEQLRRNRLSNNKMSRYI